MALRRSKKAKDVEAVIFPLLIQKSKVLTGFDYEDIKQKVPGCGVVVDCMSFVLYHKFNLPMTTIGEFYNRNRATIKAGINRVTYAVNNESNCLAASNRPTYRQRVVYIIEELKSYIELFE